MDKLSTIQKRENLNNVFACDEAGPGGAHHLYSVSTVQEPSEIVATIQLQCGARKDQKATQGVIDSDLLEIVRDRLKAFQSGPYSSRENAVALTHIEEALMWMNRRVDDRIERQVLGTYSK